MLHLSTRWGFSSIRRLALSHIEPPTPHDRLLLARTYSVDDWVVPALSALCERTTPLTLLEARQMDIEDVVLVSTVREHIRGSTIQVDAAEIPLCVEAEQFVALGHTIPPPSSRDESEDSTPLAGAWHPRFRWEKAEAEARAKAQEAMRLRLHAEAKERAETKDKARQEAKAEKARPFAEIIPRDVEERARLKAKKAHKDAEEKARLEAEKALKEEDNKARLEAEKARKDEEEKARLEVEVKKRKDADHRACRKEAWMAIRKKRAAEAKAKAAEAETRLQAEAEVEKMKRDAVAKAAAENKKLLLELPQRRKRRGKREVEAEPSI